MLESKWRALLAPMLQAYGTPSRSRRKGRTTMSEQKMHSTDMVGKGPGGRALPVQGDAPVTGLAASIEVIVGGAFSASVLSELLWARNRGVGAVRLAGNLDQHLAQSLRRAGMCASRRSGALMDAGASEAEVLGLTRLSVAQAGVDLLEMPLSTRDILSGAIAQGTLRRVAALCHAHGAKAGLCIDAAGVSREEAAALVRIARAASIDFISLDDSKHVLNVDDLADIVRAIRAQSDAVFDIRVGQGIASAAEVERLVAAGANAVALEEACARDLLDGDADKPVA